MKLLTILKTIGGKWEMSMGKLRYISKVLTLRYIVILLKHLFEIYFSAIGYIPSNYVKEKEFLGLQKYE